MSKVVLFVTLPVVAALAVWNLQLSSEVDDLRSRIDEAGTAPRAARSDAAAPSPREGSARSDPRSDPRVAELEQRLAAMERRLPAPATAAGAASPPEESGEDGETESVAVPPEWDTEAFRAAVGRVLDSHEVEKRQDRAARVAENLARAWFRDLTLTDRQRADALEVIAESLRKLEGIRQDQSLGDEQRRESLQRVQDDRLASLSGILDAAQMETVKTRVGARLRKGGGEGAGGGRGAGTDQPR